MFLPLPLDQARRLEAGRRIGTGAECPAEGMRVEEMIVV